MGLQRERHNRVTKPLRRHVNMKKNERATEGEEAPGSQTRGAAKLDTDAGFHPFGHRWSISERLLSVLQQVREREEREHRGALDGAGSLRVFKLLPLLQGAQA
ncbi:hypothetical protein MJT46_018058 [Ovis ammon polii x Ovis aries]|nr:hypothetical protein MJT46_018058 [Ovis ammon polii x Ovis aries]